MRQGNVDSAVVLFNRVLTINPGNETALQNLANIALQQKRYDEAIAHCNKLLEVDPTNATASQLLVYAYLESGRQQDATALLNKMKAEATYAFPFTISAQLYARQGDLSSAMAEINSMLSHGLMDQESLQLYVQMSAMNGIDQNTATYSYYNAYANGLEKSGDKNAAENLRKQMRGGR